MENTLGNKAKFFAQYYNLEVAKIGDNSPLCLVDNMVMSSTPISLFKDHFLELKPLSSISDEDKFFVGAEYAFSIDEYGYWDKSWTPSEVDYLRSKGYAIPFMGLSVDKMVEYGWIKLQDK